MSINIPLTVGELQKLFNNYPNISNFELNKLKVNDLVVAWIDENINDYIPAQIVKIDEYNKEYHVIYFYIVQRCCNGIVKMDRVWRPNQVKFSRDTALFYRGHDVNLLLSESASRVRELPAAIKLIEEALQRSKSTALVLSTENIESFTGTFIKNKWNGQISLKSVDDAVFGRGTYRGKVVDNVRCDTEGEFVTECSGNPVESYKGCWSENCATGPAARMEFRNGSSYDGPVVKGVACGLGVMNLSRGTVKTMFANWTGIKDNSLDSIVAAIQQGFDAFIKAVLPDNRIYQGQIGGLYGDKQGAIGAVLYPNGDFALGEMKHGCLEGIGGLNSADGHRSMGFFLQNKLNGKAFTFNETDKFGFYSDQWKASSSSVDSTPGVLYLCGSDFAPVDLLCEQIDSIKEKFNKIKNEDECYKWLLQTNQVFPELYAALAVESKSSIRPAAQPVEAKSSIRPAAQPVEAKSSILPAAQPVDAVGCILAAAPSSDSIKPSVPAADHIDSVSSILPAAQPVVQAAQPVAKSESVHPIQSTNPAAQLIDAIYLQSTRKYYVADTSAFIKVCQLATQIGKLSLEQQQTAISPVENEDNWVSIDGLADYCEQRKKAKAKRIELQTELQTQLSSKFPLFATLV